MTQAMSVFLSVQANSSNLNSEILGFTKSPSLSADHSRTGVWEQAIRILPREAKVGVSFEDPHPLAAMTNLEELASTQYSPTGRYPLNYRIEWRFIWNRTHGMSLMAVAEADRYRMEVRARRVDFLAQRIKLRETALACRVHDLTGISQEMRLYREGLDDFFQPREPMVFHQSL
jgi:hypothetical protein